MQEARAKYRDTCQEIFGSVAWPNILCCLLVWFAGFACNLSNSEGPVAVSDSSEEEFDKGTFADALQQRSFLSPQIQVSRPEIMLNHCVRLPTLDICLHVMVPRIPWPRSRRRCRRKWSRRCWLQQRRRLRRRCRRTSPADRRRIRLLGLGGLRR